MVVPRLSQRVRIAATTSTTSSRHLDGVVRGVVATPTFILLFGLLFWILELMPDGW